MLQSGDSNSGQSNTEANALVHHQAWLPLASPPIPKAWARLLGPALLPCSLASQGLCLSRPLEASLSASSSRRAPSHSARAPALGPGCWCRAGRASHMGATSAVLSGAFVSPVIGTQRSLQAPESPQGHEPSPQQSGRQRTLSGSRCVRDASGPMPEDLGALGPQRMLGY